MDILTHALSGVAAATVIASFSRRNIRSRSVILVCGCIGGTIPDFDATIGQFIQLEHNGKSIYFQKFWYSHHGFLHSMAGGLLLLVLMGVIIFFARGRYHPSSTMLNSYQSIISLLMAFFGGFLMHLIEDMKTPACVWGGVNFFWPSDRYIGGTGQIWWWNNYDLSLIVVGIIVLNTLVLHFKKRRLTNCLALFIFLLGFFLAIYQVSSRSFDFNYSGHTSLYNDYEQKSKEIQKSILGDKLYHWMERFDQFVPFNF